MTGRQEVIAELESQGMSVAEWTDAPGTHYDEHAHPQDEVLVVLDGEMTMTIGGEERRLGPGDRLDLAAGELHIATIGPDGATYLVGRRP